MITFFSVVVLGFLLGMRHATDPDHVIAVSTIVSREKEVRHAAVIGVLWGMGHTITIFVVGSAIILFKLVIPPRLGLSMELSVGLMLILLGILNLSGVTRWITETFTPSHGLAGGHLHGHPEADGGNPRSHCRGEGRSSWPGLAADSAGRLGLYQIIRPLAVGIVHGLAGSAAVALLVLTTIRDPLGAAAYLLVFGAGTVAGMMLITAAIALPFAWSGTRFAGLNRSLGIVSGFVSMSFGLFIVYQIGFVNGLFGGAPNWIPR
jgi:ABC-type nickel/cobalt efflux system permease component RcnA